jgi:hypothetical protein
MSTNPLTVAASPVNLHKEVQTTGICEHCKQHRPVWRYEPDHGMHLHEPARWTCRWCVRTDNGKGQPWLCVRCYSAEALLEEETPMDETEEALMTLLFRQSAQYEREQATAS